MSDMSAGRVNVTLEAMKQVASDEQLELSAEQLTSKEAFQASLEAMVNPFARKMQPKRKTKAEQFGRVSRALQKGDKSESLEKIEQFKEKASDFERKNPELKAKILVLLRDQIKPGMSKDEILKKVQDFYQDVSLADEAFEYLEETAEGDLLNEIREARAALNDRHGREIAAGRNIGDLARQTENIGTPTSLRDLYRDITGNPREPNNLFQELSNLYSFKDLQKVIKFLFHALGTDMKAKGPSIPRGQLHRLMTETRTLQAILGVYRFFKGRMALMEKLFAQEGLKLPQRLNFELMAKQFMTLTGERYPSPDKVLKLAEKLGIEKWIIAKIIVFSQMRDAIREVAINQIYKSLQHRDELFQALIEALEDLEEDWEEEEDDDEESEGEDEWEIEETDNKKKK